MSRKGGITVAGASATDAHLVAWWFETNGANNPVNMSGAIDSVRRFSSDGGQLVYRVRFTNRLPTGGRCLVAGAVGIDQEEGENLIAHRVLNALLSGNAPDDGQEIDVVVRDADTGTGLTPTAGRFVHALSLFDVAG